MINIFGFGDSAPQATDNAGNVLTCLVPPDPQGIYYTHLLTLQYTVGTSSHTITILREMGRTTLPNGATQGQNQIVVFNDPGNPMGGLKATSHLSPDPVAIGDWIAFQLPDGTIWFDQVALVAGLTWTLNHNLPLNGAIASAIVWWFGQIGDTNPLDPTTVYMKGSSGLAQFNTQHPRLTVPAASSGTQQINFGSLAAEEEIGFIRSPVAGSPLLIQSNNNPGPPGTIERFSWAYSDR